MAVRADLEYALASGQRPSLLPTEQISWECYVADRGLIRCNHQPSGADGLRTFLETILDRKLSNVLKDLHAFCCISNLAYQTTRKLSPDTYNEVMISVLYRLTHLSFETDALQRVVRTGLLVFSSMMFMQRYVMDKPYDHLLCLFTSALWRLWNSTYTKVPTPIALWLTVLSHIVAQKNLPPTDWRCIWLDRSISYAGIESWPQARELLRSVVWVDFIHNRPGQNAFELAMVRLKGTAHSKSSALHYRPQPYVQ